MLDKGRENGSNSLPYISIISYLIFPARAKIQYDQQTYQPAQIKLQSSYQTGLDALRNNILKYQNSIAEIQDSIAHLNSLS